MFIKPADQAFDNLESLIRRESIMPRHPRLVLPATPLHIIQRGHNRQHCFSSESDYLFYLAQLHDSVRRTACSLHAYVLMSNHVHLLLSIPDAVALASLMKSAGQRYAQYLNDRSGRSGAVWEGRYKSSLVQTEAYFLECQRYIELNPVRAGMVAFPGNYRWSSYRCNAEGNSDALLTPHSLYLRLGDSSDERRRAYQRLFDAAMAPATLNNIRVAIHTQKTL